MLLDIQNICEKCERSLKGDVKQQNNDNLSKSEFKYMYLIFE